MFRPASRLIAFAIKVVKGHDPLDSQGGKRRCLSRERSFLQPKLREEMCVGGFRDSGAVLDIAHFLFYKTTNNLRDGWRSIVVATPAPPQFRYSIRHDALRPPNAGSKSGAQAMGWLATSVMLRARIGVLVICSRERHDF